MSTAPTVLAFSGGLDTSFCVPWLIERGHHVVTVHVDTGGLAPGESEAIKNRALELGARAHAGAGERGLARARRLRWGVDGDAASRGGAV